MGGVCGLANVLGEDICRLYRLYHQANQADKDLQQRLVEPNLAVTKRFGIKQKLIRKNFLKSPHL